MRLSGAGRAGWGIEEERESRSMGVFKGAPRLVEFDLPEEGVGKNGAGICLCQLQRSLRGCDGVGKLTLLGIGGGECAKEEGIAATVGLAGLCGEKQGHGAIAKGG